MTVEMVHTRRSGLFSCMFKRRKLLFYFFVEWPEILFGQILVQSLRHRLFDKERAGRSLGPMITRGEFAARVLTAVNRLLIDVIRPTVGVDDIAMNIRHDHRYA